MLVKRILIGNASEPGEHATGRMRESGDDRRADREPAANPEQPGGSASAEHVSFAGPRVGLNYDPRLAEQMHGVDGHRISRPLSPSMLAGAAEAPGPWESRPTGPRQFGDDNFRERAAVPVLRPVQPMDPFFDQSVRMRGGEVEVEPSPATAVLDRMLWAVPAGRAARPAKLAAAARSTRAPITRAQMNAAHAEEWAKNRGLEVGSEEPWVRAGSSHGGLPVKKVGTNGDYYVHESQEELHMTISPQLDHNGAMWAQQSRLEDESTRLVPSRAGVSFPVSDASPPPIATLATHGSPFGVEGGNRQAAKVIVDEIVRHNRAFPKARIERCGLAACNQGDGRYLQLGKTNAQVIQELVEEELAQRGLEDSITVFAADRPGMTARNMIEAHTSWLGPSRLEVASWVPAREQRPLQHIHPRDLIATIDVTFPFPVTPIAGATALVAGTLLFPSGEVKKIDPILVEIDRTEPAQTSLDRR